MQPTFESPGKHGSTFSQIELCAISNLTKVCSTHSRLENMRKMGGVANTELLDWITDVWRKMGSFLFMFLPEKLNPPIISAHIIVESTTSLQCDFFRRKICFFFFSCWGCKDHRKRGKGDQMVCWTINLGHTSLSYRMFLSASTRAALFGASIDPSTLLVFTLNFHSNQNFTPCTSKCVQLR